MRASKIVLILILLCSLHPIASNAQKPKIGLVLSGGGAKGIAHIRILQALDSLGIVPDYIAGTSMGAVVGGLYAAGYTGNEIDSITKEIHWEGLFSNKIAFDQVNVEEKDEFGRYVYELPLLGLKPTFPLGLVEGQYVEDLLADLLFHVNQITDFRKLPTPFICMTADIVEGVPVVIDHGSLALAIRASMSIPTVFPPVVIDDKMLVDGGVFENLPIQPCRKMGADFIIAVDVGGGLMAEKELNSALSMLLQTTYLAGNISYQKERDKADIFIDVVKHLRYSTMDFEYVNEMFEDGDKAVEDAMPELVQLAEKLEAYNQRTIKRPRTTAGVFIPQSLGTSGISEDNKQLVLARFNLTENDTLTRSEARNKVNSLLGTRLFDKVSYTVENENDSTKLIIQGKERPVNTAKFALHYDSERGAGIILNFTKRNLGLRASRLVGTVDLAENPRGRLNYFYYFGKDLKFWHFTEAYGERMIINSFVNGTALPDVRSKYYSISTVLNRTINRKSYYGGGVMINWNQIKPKVDPRDQLSVNFIEIIEYNLSTMGVKAHYVYNTLNQVYYPSKGSYFRGESRFTFNNRANADFLLTEDTIRIEERLDGNLHNYLRFNLKGLHIVPTGDRLSLQFPCQVGLTQEVTSNEDDFSAYTFGAGDFFRLGGELQRPRDIHFPFIGLREAELSVPQVITIGARLQWNPLKNVYLSPTVDMLAAGYDSEKFWKGLPDFDFAKVSTDGAFYQVGYGVNLGYMSMIGPINVAAHNNTESRELRWFLSIGFLL